MRNRVVHLLHMYRILLVLGTASALLPFSRPFRPVSSLSGSDLHPSFTNERLYTTLASLSTGTSSLGVVGKAPRARLYSTSASADSLKDTVDGSNKGFDMDAALYCAGLAFDAYVEPAADSSRWERGSRGWKVAFCSADFTRSLYKGLLQVTVQKITDLPDASEEDNAAEQVLTGKGIDACLLVAAVEGSWKEDIKRLDREQFHEGVLDLTGAAHVGRSSTAWSNVDETASQIALKQKGEAKPYTIKGSWGKGAQAVWPPPSKNAAATTATAPKPIINEDKTDNAETRSNPQIQRSSSFFLYLQDPATARLVFTVADDNRLGDVTAIGSTNKKLSQLIPRAANSPDQWLKEWKEQAIQKHLKSGGTPETLDQLELNMDFLKATWEGQLKLTSKPKKRDKGGQMMTGAAAGAAIAGPVGAAAGALVMSFYEGEVRGTIHCQLSYLPILPQSKAKFQPYQVMGGMPGITWGELFRKYDEQKNKSLNKKDDGEDIQETELVSTDDDIGRKLARVNDLEHCFFVNHEVTGATCAVYRSLKEKVLIVSFRGTCAPVDLLTDTTLTQEAWVDGEDVKDSKTVKVHQGFRRSLDSIARRLKELILATPGGEGKIEEFDMLVTGHSLGAALATLFTADIGEYGVDAGRGLPQLDDSDAWWKSIANTLTGREAQDDGGVKPPRPKSLKLYNFGSPRVGNEAFREKFDSLLTQGKIDQAYRLVNGEDVVARLPRTMNALVFGNVNYEHVGKTVLIRSPEQQEDDTKSLVWVEGESDDNACPVRDGVALSSPTSEGSLLGDILDATKETFEVAEEKSDMFSKMTNAATKVSQRMRSLSASDIASVVGIDREFTQREVRLIQSLLQGKALAHHMEDQYYAAMGGASGFVASVGEEIRELEGPAGIERQA